MASLIDNTVQLLVLITIAGFAITLFLLIVIAVIFLLIEIKKFWLSLIRD